MVEENIQNEAQAEPIPFKAETRQLLDILIHSLYTEREIFLRELISNASDALTRFDFEMLQNREVLDPELELAVRITADDKAGTLTISDAGIGMTAEELRQNLGTIAHSGARDFIAAARSAVSPEETHRLSDLIGQFGVGFYSAFMVADSIEVVSRSYQPDTAAAVWRSSGGDTFTVEPAEKNQRGTDVILKLKEDAAEFTREVRLREIIRKHSDFIPFPIYIGDETEPVNQRTAIWRQQPREVEEQTYHDFYNQLTLDPDPPLAYAHMVIDAPVQMYAVLFIPSTTERSFFMLRRELGLKLYARKVLIQDYYKNLLPEYLGFVQGVVDSEDLPLNVSRESIQSNRVMATLKKLVTAKVLDTLKKLAADQPEKYDQFWQAFGVLIKQGVALEEGDTEVLYPLLRFHTTSQPETWSSLDDYVMQMQPGQEQIFYLLGEDVRSLVHSPHLDVIRKYSYQALLLTDPSDAFMLVRLAKYKEFPLVNAASPDLKLPEVEVKESGQEEEKLSPANTDDLVLRFKQQLGEQVADVRTTDLLSDAPARLVDPSGALTPEMQKVYRLLNHEFEAPKKILEINPRHAIMENLASLPAESPLMSLVVDQIYEDALLIEGLHPDPASMISRIQKIIEAALEDPGR